MFTFTLVSFGAISQRVAINAEGSPADSSAILDISSTSKGVLIPRMTIMERDVIDDPAIGLLIYQTDSIAGFYVYTGTAWSTLLSRENGWGVSGNSGTNPDTHFIGTMDSVPLRFRVNNEWAGEINPFTESVFFGRQSGFQDTSGLTNSGFGSYTLHSNTTGFENSAFGSASLNSNTEGFRNTAIGHEVLYNNILGRENSAFGSHALYFNIDGDGNTANGYQSLYNNTIGDNNTAIGIKALNDNNEGYSNSAIGAYTLLTNTSGYSNTAVGSSALLQNTIGAGNSAVGESALYNNFAGSLNTAVGSSSLHFNLTGVTNSAFGSNSLLSNDSGSQNVAIGTLALNQNTSGSYNTALGYNAGTAGGDWNYTINIGNHGYLNGYHQQAFIGNLSTLWTGGNTGWFTYSDARVKKDVQEDVKGLDFITRLRPVTYHRDIDTQTTLTGNTPTEDFEGKYDVEKIKFSGFLAQEVEQAAVASGYDFSGVTTPRHDKELYTLSYESFVVPLVKAVQEQQFIIDNLNKKIESIEQHLADIELLLVQKKNQN